MRAQLRQWDAFTKPLKTSPLQETSGEMPQARRLGVGWPSRLPQVRSVTKQDSYTSLAPDVHQPVASNYFLTMTSLAAGAGRRQSLTRDIFKREGSKRGQRGKAPMATQPIACCTWFWKSFCETLPPIMLPCVGRRSLRICSGTVTLNFAQAESGLSTAFKVRGAAVSVCRITSSYRRRHMQC